jgi:hypothetical protein
LIYALKAPVNFVTGQKRCKTLLVEPDNAGAVVALRNPGILPGRFAMTAASLKTFRTKRESI